VSCNEFMLLTVRWVMMQHKLEQAADSLPVLLEFMWIAVHSCSWTDGLLAPTPAPAQGTGGTTSSSSAAAATVALTACALTGSSSNHQAPMLVSSAPVTGSL
jgi:hypothetical protein